MSGPPFLLTPKAQAHDDDRHGKPDTTHEGGPFEPAPARVAAIWAPGTFVENLAIDASVKVYVTIYTYDRIERYDPATGEVTAFAGSPGKPIRAGSTPRACSG